jgi:beta-glucuronidase
MHIHELNRLWRFQPDPHDDGERLGFHRTDYDFHRWRETMVPSSFDSCLPELQQYLGVCWYRLADAPTPKHTGEDRVFLAFGAVNNRTKVWVNGRPVGEHHDPFLPFEFDITDIVREGAIDSVVVRVDNSHHTGDVPGMHTGWHQAGGIIRGVAVRAVPEIGLDDLSVVADHAGKITATVTVRNHTSAPRVLDVRVEVSDGAGNLVTTLNAPAGVDSLQAELTGQVPNVLPWSPETPVLYTVSAILSASDREIDRAEVRTGFRTVSVGDGALLLNGEPVFLTGFNRHEDSPKTGMVFDYDCTRKDLERMKSTGANAIRLCHYPHEPLELDLCDELGLLAFCEIPLYFWNNETEGRETNEQRVATAERQLRKMIHRDRNHPSVIIWSVSNETNEQHAEVAKTNRRLVRLARELDSSRLCVHVSNHWRDHPNFAEDDLICVNAYPSIDWPLKGREPGTDLNPSVSAWRDGLSRLADRYPGKPVLVTEFGYCSLPGTYGNSFGEDEHARVLEAEFAGIAETNNACGALVWCWADHPWPGGRFLDGMLLSPFGVVSRSRQALEPLQSASRMFRRKQGMAAPGQPQWPAGTGVVLLRPTLNDIRHAPLPEGFELRAMTMDESEIWVDIQRDAEFLFPISDTLFHDQFGDDPAAVSWRCFILRNEKGLGVGTISSWYSRNFRGEEWGRIHWVAIRPGYQGRGLANGMLSHALTQLALWHDKAYLDTDTRRVAAIALYLKFGFLPDMSPANAREAWTGFAQVYDHPAVREALLT